MTNFIRRHENKGPRAAAKDEVSELRDLSAAPSEFLRMLEEEKVPLKVQRLMLSFIDELSRPSAHNSPRVVKRLSGRFISHLEFAIAVASSSEHVGGPATRAIARALKSLLYSLNTEVQTRCDSLLVGDLEQLAMSLEAVAS